MPSADRVPIIIGSPQACRIIPGVLPSQKFPGCTAPLAYAAEMCTIIVPNVGVVEINPTREGTVRCILAMEKEYRAKPHR